MTLSYPTHLARVCVKKFSKEPATLNLSTSNNLFLLKQPIHFDEDEQDWYDITEELTQYNFEMNDLMFVSMDQPILVIFVYI